MLAEGARPVQPVPATPEGRHELSAALHKPRRKNRNLPSWKDGEYRRVPFGLNGKVLVAAFKRTR